VNVAPEAVRQLRERTGAGVMECKKALVDSGGDLDAAAELMRKQGLARADKKAARVAAEGVIVVERSADGRAAAMVEINCETDFVAREHDFRHFAAEVARLALARRESDLAALLAAELSTGESVDAGRRALVAKIGENISVRRCVALESHGALGAYAHRGAGRTRGWLRGARAQPGDARGGEQSALSERRGRADPGAGQGARDPGRAGAARGKEP
jgi:elongation factor Ts